jgi:MFS-type transporter involved in bile tolerance (Atg22 family)
MKSTRALAIVAALILLFTTSTTVNASTTPNKLTFFYEINLSFAFSESTADTYLEQIESGESNCKAIMSVAMLLGYADETYGNAFLLNNRYVAKNESSKTIAAGKFKPVFSKPSGSYVCRVSATINLPKANFYSILDNKGNVLVESFPRSKFKKNVALANVTDY